MPKYDVWFRLTVRQTIETDEDDPTDEDFIDLCDWEQAANDASIELEDVYPLKEDGELPPAGAEE